MKCILTWTRTCSARYIYTNPRIAIEIVNATVAIVPSGEISKIDAGPGLRVATVRVSVTLTTLAMREVPEARLTLATGSAVGVGATLAASGLNVAEIVECTDTVTIAGNASLRTESVGSRRATITTSTNYIWLARAHSAIVLAQKTARTRWITFAS